MAFQVSKQMMVVLTCYFTVSELHFLFFFKYYYKIKFIINGGKIIHVSYEMKFCKAFWVTFSNLSYAIIRYSHWGKPFDGYTHTEHIPTWWPKNPFSTHILKTNVSTASQKDMGKTILGVLFSIALNLKLPKCLSITK